MKLFHAAEEGSDERPEHRSVTAEQVLWLPYNRDLVRVELREVLRFLGERDYVQVCTSHQSYLLRATLADIERRVCGQGFMRIHRSTIVALRDVTALHHVGAGVWAVVHRDGSRSAIGRSRLRSVRLILGVTEGTVCASGRDL